MKTVVALILAVAVLALPMTGSAAVRKRVMQQRPVACAPVPPPAPMCQPVCPPAPCGQVCFDPVGAVGSVVGGVVCGVGSVVGGVFNAVGSIFTCSPCY